MAPDRRSFRQLVQARSCRQFECDGGCVGALGWPLGRRENVEPGFLALDGRKTQIPCPLNSRCCPDESRCLEEPAASRSGLAAGRHCQRAADRAHPFRPQGTDEGAESRLLHGLNMIEVHRAVGLKAISVPMMTSLGAPRIVEVMGATRTVCRRPTTSCRDRMTTGRRLSGAENV